MSSTLLNEQCHCSNASLGLLNVSNVFRGTRSNQTKKIVAFVSPNGLNNDECYTCNALFERRLLHCSALVSPHGLKNDVYFMCSVFSPHGFKNDECYMCSALVSPHS